MHFLSSFLLLPAQRKPLIWSRCIYSPIYYKFTEYLWKIYSSSLCISKCYVIDITDHIYYVPCFYLLSIVCLRFHLVSCRLRPFILTFTVFYYLNTPPFISSNAIYYTIVFTIGNAATSIPAHGQFCVMWRAVGGGGGGRVWKGSRSLCPEVEWLIWRVVSNALHSFSSP